MTACGSVFDSVSLRGFDCGGGGAVGVGVIIGTSISWTAPSILFMNFAAAASNFDYYYSVAIAATTFIFSSAR